MAMIENEPVGIDTVELRRAFGTFVTGITVVTTRDSSGAPRGLTANSFTSVSLDPPLLLVCIAKSAGSFQAFQTSDCFAVNILHEQQRDLALLFASKSATKFSHVTCETMHTGAPVLADSLTWFDCSTQSRVDAGDHVILIGRVRAFGTSPAAPLGFCRGRFVSVEDPIPAGWAPSQRMVTGCLIEHDGRLLLRGDSAGGWNLPTARRDKMGSKLALEDGNGTTPLLDDAFLYSIFDLADREPGCIIYRGRLDPDSARSLDTAPDLRFFTLDDLPWDAIPLRQVRGLLRRYLRERNEERFGIYVESPDGGEVAMIDGAPLPWRMLHGEQQNDKR